MNLKQLIRTTTFLAIAFSVIILSSCSKDDDGGTDNSNQLFLKVNLGSEQININEEDADAIEGSFGTIPFPDFTYYGGGINVQTPSGTNDSKMFIIQIYDDNPINTSTYSGYQEIQPGLYYGVQFLFSTGTNYYSSDENNTASTVTITSINNNRINGTFSGTVINLMNGETVNITNGEFSVENAAN